MPKLKPATILAKIEALNVELDELQCQRQQLLDSASHSPLIGRYIATKTSGGTAFSGQSEKQAAHSYYALVDAAGTFIQYIAKQEVAEYRDRIQLGKKVSKLNRAISRCAKRIDEYQSKLSPAEQTGSSAVSTAGVQHKPKGRPGEDSVPDKQESKLYKTTESYSWTVSEAA